MRYLTRLDYSALITLDHLADITQGKQSRITKAEVAAMAEMSSYLNARFNTAKIFLDVSPYSNTRTYNAGDLCYFETEDGNEDTGAVYRCIEACTGVGPTDEAKWEQGDDRNPIIVLYMTDCALYHIHFVLNPRNIPEMRADRYDQAIDWLNKVTKGAINPDLPLLVAEEDKISPILFASNQKRNLRF